MKQIRIITALAIAAILFAGCQCRKDKAQPAPQETPVQTQAETIPDFKLPNADGTEAWSVMDEVRKHKVTILDFWASWCGPCIHEAPNLVAVYEQYHEKGLGIVGISLDEDDATWRNAINRLNMQWAHVSDLKGWDSEAAHLFDVTSIPYTIVVDGKGKILAKGLRGGELSAFIAQALN